MSKKHAKIEQLDGKVDNSKFDVESDDNDIAKDSNHELRTYLTYAEYECCTFSAVSKEKYQQLGFLKILQDGRIRSFHSNLVI